MGIFAYIYHKNQPKVGKKHHIYMDPMGTWDDPSGLAISRHWNLAGGLDV